MNLTYGSVCSGIEAPTVAWHGLGWTPHWFSEIDPFASAVLAHRYPHVPNLGDMSKIDGGQLDPVDVFIAGTPCQSFSVAGLRAGLADPRGNLALVFLGLVDRVRPSWVVWENVPGVLSSWSDAAVRAPTGDEQGRIWRDECDGAYEHVEQTNDFDCFLSGLSQLGYGWAWRVLDAQFFGVPQRRRRVFVVGHLGGWQRAAAVLFERHCLSRNFAPSREAGKTVAAVITSGIGRNSGQDLEQNAIVDTLTGNGNAHSGFKDERRLVPALARCVTAGEGRRQDYETITLVSHALRADGFDASEDGTGRGTPLVPVAVNETSGALHTSLNTSNGHGNDDRLVLQPRMIDMGGGKGMAHWSQEGDPSYALTKGEPHAVAFAFQTRCTRNDRGMPSEVVPALTGTTCGGHADTRPHVGGQGMQVRRLTPVECERLQGFPDNYTRIPGRKSWRDLDESETPESCRELGLAVKQTKGGKWKVNDPDGPRYRALGNSIAVPVLTWIGQRIELVESLFPSKAK